MHETGNSLFNQVRSFIDNFAESDPSGRDFYEKTQRELAESGFVDADYYLLRYPDVRSYADGPVAHFLRHGYYEGRSPSPALPEERIAELLRNCQDNKELSILRYMKLLQDRLQSIENRIVETRPVPPSSGGAARGFCNSL